MVTRKAYMGKLIPLIDKKIIKVITGVRRSGKTVFLTQIQDYLVESGRRKEQIIYVSLESKKSERFKDGNLLYEYLIDTCNAIEGKAYIFLDEVQLIDKWEEVISSLLVDTDCDVYITGSNSKLLSGELATLIAGRYIQLRLYPFSLAEAKAISIENGTFVSDEKLFGDYLKYGGLPMRFTLDETSVEQYLSDVYDSIVTKDIVKRNKIKNIHLLGSLLSFLMDNIANPFSTRSIVATLASMGVKTTIATVTEYIEAIKNAMIIYPAVRYDLKGKKLLSTNEKYYAVDSGLRNAVKNSDVIDYNKLYENIVFIELLNRGYEVTVGKLDDNEIDFVAYKGEKRSYYQVCYALDSDKTVAREFGNLKKIKDNYPKYVISGDIPDFSQNGIIHYNIIDFLLNK